MWVIFMDKTLNCTSCRSGVLETTLLDGLFKARTCSNCGGHWILVEDFVDWKKQNLDHAFIQETDWSEDQSIDTTNALLCPVTGVIMRKIKITTNTNHRIDYSHTVGGIWLDKGEWELLKSEEIAGQLNSIVTKEWQNKLRTENTTHNFADFYEQKFGQEEYEKLKEIRAWLDTHPKRADLKAYLMADNPYSAVE
jgi:Zn-finger nucleic acid-binding protein